MCFWFWGELSLKQGMQILNTLSIIILQLESRWTWCSRCLVDIWLANVQKKEQGEGGSDCSTVPCTDFFFLIVTFLFT